MRQITQAEFNQHQIFRLQPSVAEILGFEEYTEERSWFAHDDLLGIVLFDKVDSDWSFVALHDDGAGYRAFDTAASFPSQQAATQALEKVLITPDDPCDEQRRTETLDLIRLLFLEESK